MTSVEQDDEEQKQADRAALEETPSADGKSRDKMKSSFPDYSKYKITEDKDLQRIKDDDYDRIVNKVREDEANPQGPSEIDNIEEELQKIQDAEAEKQAAEAQDELSRKRSESRKRIQKQKEFEEERREAREEIEDGGEDAFPEISNDEIHWNGLHDE
jgi:hypothetical protein